MRQNITLLLLLLLATASVRCQNPCSTNSGPNFEALKWLANSGVRVYPELNRTNVTQCAGEFTAQGSCCDVQSLTNVIKTFNNNILNKWKKYIGKISIFRSKLLKAAQALSPRLTQSLVSSKIGILNNVGGAAKLASVLPLIPREAAGISDLKAWIDGFEANIKDFKAQGKVCYERLRSYRAGIFCAICSGNNANYVSPQVPNRFTYRISQDQCSTLVNDCFGVWRFNFNLLSLTQFMVVLRSRVDGTSSYTSFTPDYPLSSDAIYQLRDTFENCKFNSTTKAVTCGNDSELDKYLGRLCYNGFIGNRVNSYLEGDESAFTDIDMFDNMDLVNKETTANSRLLQSMAPIVSLEMAPITSNSFVIKPASGLESTDSVETGSAGDTSASFLLSVTALLSWALCALALL